MVEERVQRRLAAILAADVVGYSRLIRADEVGTLERLRVHRAELIDPQIAEHDGRIVKLMGDGALVEFASVVDAVHCAAAIQGAMPARNEGEPEDRRIVFRIGINLGDVIVEGDDIHGDGVNIAARLEGLSNPGGVCVSGVVYESVKDKLDLGFDDLGPQTVKNIPEPVRVYALRIESSEELSTRDLPLPSKPSIAVLPFDNMSGDPEQEYFADGIADDIITELSRFRELFVIARNSSFTYKGQAVDIKRVGRELGVRYVLEGGVRKAGNRVRIAVQLIEAESGNHLWAEKFDGDLADTFELQDRITASVSGIIQPTMFRAEIERTKRKSLETTDAYDLQLQGWSACLRMVREGYFEGLELAHAAVRADETYSAAHTLVAWVNFMGFLFGWADDPQESLRTAAKAAQQAVELDDADAQAHVVLAFTHVFEREYNTAVAESERALQVNPNLAWAEFTRGVVCVYTGQPKDGAVSCERAIRLSPRDPFTFAFLNALSICQYALREYSASVVTAAKIVALKPDYLFGHWHTAIACAQLGHMDQARRAFEEVVRINPNFDRAFVESVAPFQNPDELEHQIDGLKKAGWDG